MAETDKTQDESEQFQEHPEVLSIKKTLPGMSKDKMKKNTDSLRTEISQLSGKIDQLKKTREENNAQARHYRKMRDNVSGDKYSDVNRLRDSANQEKELRDECNEKIRINKQRREELRDQVKDAWAKVAELRNKYYQMKDEVGVMPEDITKEIRDLEWKQQTESLDPDEDAKLTLRIVDLYEKAYAAHLIGFSSEELDNSIAEAKKISEQHDEAHENVLNYHQKGQEHHERLQELYSEMDELRSGGDNLHEKFIEARQAADLAHQKIVEIYERIKLNQYMMDLIDDEQTNRRHEKAAKLREERIEETKQKQSSSKRLSLEELRLLIGDEEEEEEE